MTQPQRSVTQPQRSVTQQKLVAQPQRPVLRPHSVIGDLPPPIKPIAVDLQIATGSKVTPNLWRGTLAPCETNPTLAGDNFPTYTIIDFGPEACAISMQGAKTNSILK